MNIDGKTLSSQIRGELKEKVTLFKDTYGFAPGLAVILVGSDPASQVYVRNKHRACEELGMTSFEYTLPEDTKEEELIALLNKLNADTAVHGILVQLPLPRHINEGRVIETILPEKDVDAFHPQNIGALTLGKPIFAPCTPAGVMEMFDRYNIPIEGKNCVIIGRSNIVGKPMALLMLSRNATVTICHSRTKDLSSITSNADILIAAIGKPRFVTADMVKENAVVIDVGINRLADGKLCGDVDFGAVAPKASYITPVPGGVGPMTITMLMKNTYAAALNFAKK